MVILASELCKLRIGAPLSRQNQQALLTLIDQLETDYPLLWKKRNFEKGVEIFLRCLQVHKDSLLSYPVNQLTKTKNPVIKGLSNLYDRIFYYLRFATPLRTRARLSLASARRISVSVEVLSARIAFARC